MENGSEVEVTVASCTLSVTAGHIGQRTKGERGSAGEVTGGVTTTCLTMSPD